MEKDFNSASLRNIVKTAGVTTGAFYGYFSGKEALFAALVEEHAKAIMNIFMSAQEDFEKLPEEEKANHMGVESRTSLNKIVDYIYEHFDEFKLIICKSEGTSYENLYS
ncbi:MAG: TetR/AcrR family transcriptional regulator [Anaerotruncus sp.]|nr:MAG: TetR/AcrR family transcriptional regulator [Anaerotruncus sp.]